MLVRIAIALLLAWACGDASFAQAPSIDRGHAYARAHCARCHAIDRKSASPLAVAPPFRTLHERYPVDSLAEALAEGIVTGHNEMPEFRLEPNQISDLIAFLKSLER